MKRRRHRQSRVRQPKYLVYPEIPTLSVMDINHDLEFLFQNRRIPSSYDMLFGGPPPLWGQTPPFSSRSGLSTPGGLPGLGRPVGLGLGPSNGPLPSANQNLGVPLFCALLCCNPINLLFIIGPQIGKDAALRPKACGACVMPPII